MTFSIIDKRDTQHNDIHHNDSVNMLSVIMLNVTYKPLMLCHYAECRGTTSAPFSKSSHDNLTIIRRLGFLKCKRWYNDTEHNDIQHNDSQHKGLICDT